MAAEPYVGEGAAPLSDAERAFLRERLAAKEAGGGYNHIQRTRPQTLAYGLAAWILDKWWAWSDCGGDLERRFTKTSCSPP
jgi:hypothetical protein